MVGPASLSGIPKIRKSPHRDEAQRIPQGAQRVRKWSVENKTAAGMVLAVLTIALMALAANATIQGLLTNNRLVNHTHDVRIGLQEQLSTLYEAEAEARAFVISGDERFAGQYQNTTQLVWAQHQRLAQLTIDNPVQQRRLPPLRLAIDRRLGTLSRMIEIRRSDPPAASAYVRSGIGI